MLLQLRKNHAILYSFLVVVIFVAINLGFKCLCGWAANANLIPAEILTQEYQYVWMLIFDTVMALVMILILKSTKRMNLLTKRGCGVSKCIKVSLFPLIYSCVTVLISLYMVTESDYTLSSLGSILIFTASMLMVGVAEELIARAIIAETLLEHFGLERQGILKAWLLSSVIFGAMHFTNLAAMDSFSVLLQAIGAMTGGMIFAAIYFRTGSLGMAIFVHAFNDFAGLFFTGFFSVGSIAETVNEMGQVGFTRLLPAVVLAFVAFFLLRKSKIDEVKAQWQNEVEGNSAA